MGIKTHSVRKTRRPQTRVFEWSRHLFAIPETYFVQNFRTLLAVPRQQLHFLERRNPIRLLAGVPTWSPGRKEKMSDNLEWLAVKCLRSGQAEMSLVSVMSFVPGRKTSERVVLQLGRLPEEPVWTSAVRQCIPPGPRKSVTWSQV
jgi:hypothetical protein